MTNLRKRKTMTPRRLPWIVLLIVTAAASAQQPSTKLILDRETFAPASYATLQQLADQVAATIDQLIPGQVSEFVHGDILCFQVTTKTLGKAPRGLSPPITLSNDYKLPYEPAASVAGRTRIALFEVEPLYAPSYRERFVYQLSHELAHVKMGVRIDNSLVETLAVAISHEVLVRQGMTAYANSEFNEQMHRLPDEIQRAYVAASLTVAQRYWQSRTSADGLALDGRPVQSLGAALIRTKPVLWPAFLGIALVTACDLDTPGLNFKVCAPNLGGMDRIKPVLLSLGYFQGLTR